MAAPAAAPMSVPTIVLAALLPSSLWGGAGACTVYDGGGGPWNWRETTVGADRSKVVGALEMARDLASDRASDLASDRASDLASDLASDRASDLASDLATDLASDTSDLGGAMLSVLIVLALLLAFETTERLELSIRAIVGPLASDDMTEALLGRYTASMLLPSKSMTAALKYPDCESRILGSPWIFAPAFRALMKNEPTASFDGAGKATWTAPGGDLWFMLALSKDGVFFFSLCI